MDHKELMDSFDEFYNYWSDIHEAMNEDIRFARDGEHWADDLKERRKNKNCLTFNKFPSYARQVINDARQNKPAIKVYPADDSSDPKTAEVINGLIRNIEYISDAEVAYDTALENSVYAKIGYWEVDIDYTRDDVFDQDLLIKPVPDSCSVYGDPSSTAFDASDWNRCFIEFEISKEDFNAQYPDAAEVDAKDLQKSGWGDYVETVRLLYFYDRTEVDDILCQLSNGNVAYYSDIEGELEEFALIGVQIIKQRPVKRHKVVKGLMSGAEVLEEKEWPGKYIPIIPIYGETYYSDGERKFKSMFSDAYDAAKSYNYFRSAAADAVTVQANSPYIGPKGAFDSDAQRWATAHEDDWPYLEYEGDVRPTREPPPQPSAGALSEVMAADQDMRDIIGIQSAALGMQSNEVAGIAIDARKEESDNSNFHFIDNLSRGIRYCGRVLLDLIPYVYNEERIVRVMGWDGEFDTAHINAGEIDLTRGKYDLTVEVGPSYTTKRKEAVANMMELVTSFPEVARVIGDLVAKNMDWDGADEIAKRLKTLLPPEILAMDEMGDIPEEARPFIAAAQQNVQQIQMQLQERDAVLQQYQQAMQQMEQQLNNKQGEQALKKYAEDNKVQMQLMEQNHEKQMAVLEETLKERFSAVEQQMGAVSALVNNALKPI